MKKLNKVHIALIMAALLVAVAIVAFMLGRRSQPEEETKLPVAEETAVEPQMRELSLYFAGADGTYLVPENREVPQCEEDAACLLMTVEALIAGPTGELVPVLPQGVSVLSASEEEGVAVLDFDRSFIDLHPGGSSSELLTVYALVDTLAVNFPHIRKLRILVDGEPIETIKGHVDLRQPVAADFGYTRLPEGGKALPESLPADVPAGENEAGD